MLASREPIRRTGRYEIRGTVGGGGMGDVYRAFDPVTRRELALKVLKFTYPRALHYFKREFRAVARLNHPNLVRLYDLHLDEGAYFFTMELVDGSDLYLYVNGHNRVVSDRGVLVAPDRVGRIRETFTQLMRALAHLHDHGCVHRDIKPSNVLVDRHGTVKLVDFGIVKELLPGGEGQSLSQVFGTSTYFSPEQSQGSNVGAATDLYAAGVVLYELLCGSPPFEGESSEVALKHRSEKPRAVQDRVAGCDEVLGRVCMELLSKEPSLRPSAREALEMLGAEVRDDEPLDFEFVGRRGPRKLLHQCLEAVRRGEGRLVVIEGSSGTGKSALVEAFAKDARLFGASAFSGQCVHRDHVPLRGLDTVVERLAEAYRKRTARILRRLPEHVRGGIIEGFSFLGELLPTDQHGPPGEPPGQGLKRLLAALAADRLLIVTVEHLHLADDATLDVLEELQAGGELPPLLFLLTLRPEAAAQNPRIAAFLELVAAHPRAHRLRLDVFSLEETRQLLDDAVPEAPSWLAEHVHAETGGVPLFVAEMAADLKRDPTAEAPSFEDAVARRIARMSADAQRVLSALSLCPRPVPGVVLERACHLEVDALHAALDVLDAADLVRTEVDSQGNLDAVPVHPRLMEVARQALDVRQSQDLHQRLAQAYQIHKGSAFDVRHHWTAAGQPDHAVAYARREAVNARRLNDHGRAADLLALALEGASDDLEEQVRLRAWLADSLAMSGRYLEAAQALDDLARLSPPEGNRWRARRCQLYLMAGNLADFDRLAVDLPASARVPLADLLLPLDPARAEQLLGDADTRTARLVRGRLMAGTHSRRAIAEARRLVDSVEVYGVRPEPSRQAGFAIARAQVLRAAGEEALAATTIRQARALLTADEPDHDLVGLRLWLGEAETALERGRVREARAAGRQLLVAARARGLTGLRARACVLQARVHLEAGEPEPAARLVDEAARCWPPAPRAMPHVDQALVRARQALHASDLHRAESVLLALRRDESLRSFLGRRAAAREFALLHARICAVRALRRWNAGEDSVRAVQALVGARTALERALPKPDGWLCFFDAVVELVEDRAEEAHTRIEQALRTPDPWPDNPQIEALLLLVMAQALARRGESVTAVRDEALELLAEAGAGVPPEGEPLLG